MPIVGCAATSVLALAVLFNELESVVVDETVAVFISVELAGVLEGTLQFNEKFTCAVAGSATVELAVTVPPTAFSAGCDVIVQPAAEFRLKPSYTVPAGSVTVKAGAWASLGPLLMTVTPYCSTLPAMIGLKLGVRFTVISQVALALVVIVAELLPGVPSLPLVVTLTVSETTVASGMLEGAFTTRLKWPRPCPWRWASETWSPALARRLARRLQRPVLISRSIAGTSCLLESAPSPSHLARPKDRC